MTSPPGGLFLVAGEPSGDTHGAHLIEELTALWPDLPLRGLGGPRMAGAGMELRFDLASRAIMGLFPVIRALPWIRRVFHETVRELEERPPGALVLVDYPGFNMRLAARARQLGIPVIYYISPQVWAWASWRVKRLARLCDLMLVILPFEQEVYRGSGLKTVYVGHPLMDRLQRHPLNPAIVTQLTQGADHPRVGLFPGSRRHVVQSLLPIFLESARRLTQLPGTEEARFLLALSQESFQDLLPPHRPHDPPLLTSTGHPLEVMAASELCLTSSGTTTLEIAAAGRPFVIGYRVSPVLYLLGRLLISVKHIGLVNLVAGRGIVPEHVGVRSFAAAAASDLQRLWTDSKARQGQLQGLKEVRAALDRKGSYHRAAQEIQLFLTSRS